jgi:hypothetical protein
VCPWFARDLFVDLGPQFNTLFLTASGQDALGLGQIWLLHLASQDTCSPSSVAHDLGLSVGLDSFSF